MRRSGDRAGVEDAAAAACVEVVSIGAESELASSFLIGAVVVDSSATVESTAAAAIGLEMLCMASRRGMLETDFEASGAAEEAGA